MACTRGLPGLSADRGAGSARSRYAISKPSAAGPALASVMSFGSFLKTLDFNVPPPDTDRNSASPSG